MTKGSAKESFLGSDAPSKETKKTRKSTAKPSKTVTISRKLYFTMDALLDALRAVAQPLLEMPPRSGRRPTKTLVVSEETQADLFAKDRQYGRALMEKR